MTNSTASAFTRRSGVFAAARLQGALAAAALVHLFAPTPAFADLRLCNMTSSRIGVAVGYRDPQGWATEGWWNLRPNACETLIKGTLTSRYYYVYAQDYDRGGEWAGQTPLCTRDKEFLIRGSEDCLARGFERTRFFEVDTGEQKHWTVQMVDPAKTAPQRP